MAVEHGTDGSIAPTSAPILSTPDTHIFDEPVPNVESSSSRLSDEQLNIAYEIGRTVNEIRAGRWKRIALQFPDSMLVDAPRVYQALSRGLTDAREQSRQRKRLSTTDQNETSLTEQVADLSMSRDGDDSQEHLFVLADTSYGACCVDEVAAEHVDADVVVHYGRTCLSPTSRLPVIYVFTQPPLYIDAVIAAFRARYTDLSEKIILMADVPYMSYLPKISEILKDAGYTNSFTTALIRDPSSQLPNRTVPAKVEADKQVLKEYQLFHIADPPPSLLLTLSSRTGDVTIFPTNIPQTTGSTLPGSAMRALQRRYAILTSLSTVPIFGILINTLSVKNYKEILEHVKKQILDAGKKSYTFVVGKVNAAKVANFSEVGGWVVIGCWESSLFESKDFWKPIITPFELKLALESDAERVWTGAWTSDFQAVIDEEKNAPTLPVNPETSNGQKFTDGEEEDAASDDESEPPEFDLRTGRYVSHSRPMRPRRTIKSQGDNSNESHSKSLITRAKGDLATVGNQVSPAAEFFTNQRSWRGLGTDFAADEDEGESASGRKGARMEVGRSGVARGYVVGEDTTKR